MGKGMNSYDDKRKRAMRRKNHIARDLRTEKYRQRKIELKKDKKPTGLRWQDFCPDLYDDTE